MTVFVDSNIPMYLVSADHLNKAAVRSALELAIAAGESLVTDAEVLHEILHRYVAINRRDAIDPAMDALLAVVDEVYPSMRRRSSPHARCCNGWTVSRRVTPCTSR